MILFKKSNIPNFLSVFRIFLVPVFLYLFLTQENTVLALVTFLVAGLTDVVDGIIARKYNWITNVGKILDPFADKCMQMSALFCLGKAGLISWWVASVLMVKELILLVGATTALKSKKVYVQSDWYGKAGTVAFYIIATILVLVEDISPTVRMLLGILLIAFMLFALIMYVIDYKKNIMPIKEAKPTR
jgi:cardiolipin synthase